MSDIRELDQIQIEIERLHERSQSNKAEIQSHEAVKANINPSYAGSL